MKKSLLVAPEKITALDVFCNDKTESIIQSIEIEARSFVNDVETSKGRDEIASLAYKISRSKTALDNLGKEMVSEWKNNSKLVDADRRLVRDRLDSLRDEIKEPLTKWTEEKERIKREAEDAEINRIESIDYAIAHIKDSVNGLLGASSGYIKERMDSIDGEINQEEFEEFTETAIAAKAAAIETLQAAYDERLAYETQQAEQAEREKKMAEQQAEMDKKQAKINAEIDEQERQKREEQIKREAAEQATVKAEQKAAADIKEARDREKQAEIDAETAKTKADEAVERAKKEAAETEERVKREAEELKRKEKAETEAREADINHRREINASAVLALVEGGMDDEEAKKAITLIAKRKIPAVTISY